MTVSGQISIANVRLGFRNFAGAEGPYNKKGDRNFVVFLEEQQAKDLESDGWNIKWPKEREEVDPDSDFEQQPFLPVSFSFTNFPPKIVLVTDGNASRIGEDEVDMLDWAEIENADIVIRPYNWSVNGNSGVKAYLKALYVTLATDEFSSKYGI